MTTLTLANLHVEYIKFLKEAKGQKPARVNDLRFGQKLMNTYDNIPEVFHEECPHTVFKTVHGALVENA